METKNKLGADPKEEFCSNSNCIDYVIVAK